MYKNVDDIDLFLGGVIEKPREQGSIVGPTFRYKKLLEARENFRIEINYPYL